MPSQIKRRRRPEEKGVLRLPKRGSVTIDDIIHVNEYTPNLALHPDAYRGVLQPAGVADQPLLETMIQELKGSYDYIIIDFSGGRVGFGFPADIQIPRYPAVRHPEESVQTVLPHRAGKADQKGKMKNTFLIFNDAIRQIVQVWLRRLQLRIRLWIRATEPPTEGQKQ